MRIVSWNLHGAPAGATNRQLERAWHHLGALDPDVILLQEIRHSVIPDWVRDEWDLIDGEAGLHGKTGNWGSGIAARRALNLRSTADLLPEGSWLSVAYDYVVIGEIDLTPTEPALLGSVHAPAMGANKMLASLGKPEAISADQLVAAAIEPTKPWSTDVIFHGLDRVKGHRFIIGGDWNTSRLFDCNRKVPANALFFSRAHEHGGVEVMGKANETRSFFRSDNPPYQLDHVFADATTESKILSCGVWADPADLETSDHAPLVIDLDIDIEQP